MALAFLPRRKHARLGAVELWLIVRMLGAIDLRRGRRRWLVACTLSFLRTRRAKRCSREAAEDVEQRAAFACGPALRFRFRRRRGGLRRRRPFEHRLGLLRLEHAARQYRLRPACNILRGLLCRERWRTNSALRLRLYIVQSARLGRRRRYKRLLMGFLP